MPKLINVRQRYSATTEGVTSGTPWEHRYPDDEPAVITGFVLPPQPFARGSVFRIDCNDDGSCAWSVEDAIERSSRFAKIEGLQEMCDLLRSSGLPGRETAVASILAVAMTKLASALELNGHVVVLARAILVPPRSLLKVWVEGDPENRPIRFRLMTLLSKRVGY